MIMTSVIKGLTRFEARCLQRQINRRNARKKIIANDNSRPVQPLPDPASDPAKSGPSEPSRSAAEAPTPKFRKIKRTAQNANAPDWALENDAYYTKPHVAEFIGNVMRTFAPADAVIVEPSAGGGAILDQFPGAVGIDIHPTRDDIVKANFLNDDVATVAGLTTEQQSRLCIVGNPPYGEKSSMAVAFLNKALSMADTVGFILPISFGYHEVQQYVTPSARLIVDIVLPRASFTLAGKGYGVWSRFQIWTTKPAVAGAYVYQGKVEWIGRGGQARVGRAKIKCGLADDLRSRSPEILECDDFKVLRRRGDEAPAFAFAIPVPRSSKYESNITTDPAKIVSRYEYWFVVAKTAVDLGKMVARLLKIPFLKLALRHCHRGQRFVMFDAIKEYRLIKAAESSLDVAVNDDFEPPTLAMAA